MYYKLFFFLICSLGISIGAFASSVRLKNDTAFPLRAVIHGADGTFLGDILVNPQATVQWSDSYNPLSKDNLPPQGPSNSQTPYTVVWYCKDGSTYGMCENVSTGGMVRATQCTGPRHCGPPGEKEKAQSNESGVLVN